MKTILFGAALFLGAITAIAPEAVLVGLITLCGGQPLVLLFILLVLITAVIVV